MRNNSFWTLVALIILLGAPRRVEGQWLTQTITVTNGWTAAYLYVDASSQPILPGSLGQPIATNNPIDQVWLWKVPISTAQYISTPNSPLSGGGQWVSWTLTNSQNSLAAMIPNAAYLIHSTANSNFDWKIQGQPVPPRYTWDLTGLNFIGFQTPVTKPPSFQDYFAQDPDVQSTLEVYEYLGGEFTTNTSGNPAELLPLAWPSTLVTRGRAFWVSATNVNNTYFGPFNVELPNPNGINYGTSGGQLTFHLVNVTSKTLTVSATLVPSEPAPAGQTPIIGPPPLLLKGVVNSNLIFNYTSLATNNSTTTTNVVSWTLAPYGQPGSDVAAVLGVNRFAMTNGSPGALYAGILRFGDSLGFSEVDVPVSATVASNNGLWVGAASVTQVAYDMKHYATNADGTLVISAVTTQSVSTNSGTSLTTTNLTINRQSLTQIEFDYTNLISQVINNYTTNIDTLITNAIVVSTNLTVQETLATNITITTEVTGYYYTNNGMLIVWLTENDTNPPEASISFITNNVTYVTNFIAAVPTNGTPVLVTNVQFVTVYSYASLVTNDIFMDPVTTPPAIQLLGTNISAATTHAPAYNMVTTNFAAVTYSNLMPAAVINYAGTNTTVFNYPPVTNFIPTLQPLLYVTNHGNLISANAVTNIFVSTTNIAPFAFTNYQLINNYFVVASGATNLVASLTNLASVRTPFEGRSSTITNVFYTANLATNPLFVVVTTQLSSPSNYVVTAYSNGLDLVASPYPLRLIVFQGSNSACCLLQRVYYGISQDTNLVISTTQKNLDARHLDSARRITATAMPWSVTNAPFYFNGSLDPGATLTTTVADSYDDQTSNPFLHTYHPDHNNLDMTVNPPQELAPGIESYTIQRQITLQVIPGGTDFVSLTLGNSLISGNYSETITLSGSASKSYQTQGTFLLKQISTIPTLSQ